MAQLRLELRRPDRRRIRTALLCLWWLGAAPVAADEIHKWVDEQGREHFGNKRPAAAVPVENAGGGVLNQAAGKAAPEAESAEPGSENVAERLSKLRRQNAHPANMTPKPVDPAKQPKRTEAWCKKTYNKTCKEVEAARAKALEECQAGNLEHCEEPASIASEEAGPTDEAASTDGTTAAKPEEDVHERNARKDRDDEEDDDGEDDDDADDDEDPDDDPDDDDGEDDGEDEGEDDDNENADRRPDNHKPQAAENNRRQTAKPRPPPRPRAAR